MTRFFAIISCLLLLMGLCVGASAADNTRATSVNIIASVSSNGSCDVTTAVTLHVDNPQSKLSFPVPANASNVTLNGKPVFTEKTSQARMVDLGNSFTNISGDYSFTVGYSIHSVVKTLDSTSEESQAKRLQLELPLLAGFSYPIDQLQFSINLPGNNTQTPRFTSGYHQANIEKDLTYSTSGASIAGRSWRALKDHETLVMYLDTTEELFPQTRADLPVLEDVTTLIGICTGVAVVFWILFLRNYLPLRRFPAVAPEGFGAGQMGTVLSMAGTDLNLMVFSWAQLGYVSLRMDHRGRVYIYKQMDMGNERTGFEQKCFRILFTHRQMIDTSSASYQRLTQTVRVQRSAKQLFRKKRDTTHVKIFRGLTAAAGLLCGTCFGIILGTLLDYGWAFMLILSIVGLICSWQIQFWPDGIFLHHPSRFWMAAILSVLWLVLGAVVGQFPLSLLAVSIQTIGGFLAFFGGRRTEEGRMAMGQVLSLRRFLRTLSHQQAQLLLQDNPETFFSLLPYAIALGCGNAFARHFGKSRLPVCPYLQTPNSHGLTGRQWYQLMRHVMDNMSIRKRSNPLSGFHSVLRNYMR